MLPTTSFAGVNRGELSIGAETEVAGTNRWDSPPPDGALRPEMTAPQAGLPVVPQPGSTGSVISWISVGETTWT